MPDSRNSRDFRDPRDSRDSRAVLVTGGAGYIGSHVVADLLADGRTPVVIDDFSNASPEVFDRLRELTGHDVEWMEGDITDAAAVAEAFRRWDIGAVMHFAGRKAVGESCAEPELYLDVNVGGTATLLAAMRDAGVRRFVFSSSCSVYGETGGEPLTEDAPTGPTNPYAWSKLTCEGMLGHVTRHREGFAAVSLRYFNPIGAHPTALLGEDGRADSPNIMPRLLAVAAGNLDHLTVLGDDYPTRDGTCIRDYLHVVDVARAHVLALDLLDEPGHRVLNLGTGVGTTVLELVDAMAAASGNEVPVRIGDRRPGDVTVLVADAREADRLLGWRPEFDVARMCADAWRHHLARAERRSLG